MRILTEQEKDLLYTYITVRSKIGHGVPECGLTLIVAMSILKDIRLEDALDAYTIAQDEIADLRVRIQKATMQSFQDEIMKYLNTKK